MGGNEIHRKNRQERANRSNEINLPLNPPVSKITANGQENIENNKNMPENAIRGSTTILRTQPNTPSEMFLRRIVTHSG